MQRRKALLLLNAAAMGLWFVAAHAGAIADCNDSPDLELQIKACSIIIDDGTTSIGNRALALGNRGNAYGMLRRPRDALADYAAAIALDPHDPLTYYNRANVLFDLGRWQEAVADYSRAIARHEAFALAYFNRALAREKLGDLTGATQDYTIAEAFNDPIAAKAKARREKLGAIRPPR